MKNRGLSSELQRLNDLISRTESSCGDNLELRSDWAKYICVLSSGLMENGIKAIYIEYAQNSVSGPVARFVSSKISQIRNPKTEKFLEIAAAFKEAWKVDLESYTIENERGTALDSIMTNRHLIVHGKSNNSNITMSAIKDYLKKSVEILEFIEDQCGL